MGESMPEKKTVEEQLEGLRKIQAERIEKIKQRDREKLKKLNKKLSAIKRERFAKAGGDLAKLFKAKGEQMAVKDVVDICKKYWAEEGKAVEAGKKAGD
jgi:23S rRNA A1618 N6-methylase RlmF